MTRLDEDDLAFRYHEVFRAYLENRLVERDGEAQAKEWSRLAAALLEDEGRSLSDALRAYCWAGDWMAVGRILEVGGSALADDASPWLDWLPAGLVADDPWVMLATARRAGATGRFAAALDLYQRVEALPTGGTAPRDVARRERAVVTAWLDPAAPPSPGWPGQLRSVLRARPASRPPAGTTVTIRVHTAGDEAGSATVGAITTAPGLPEEATDPTGLAAAAAVAPGPGVPGGPGDTLVDAVGAVLAGQLAVGAGRLTALADDPDVPLAIAAGARLVSLLATALAGRPVSGEQEDLGELVELVDMPWLASLALAAGGLAGGAGAERALDVALEREAHGDPWGAAAARLCAGLGSLLAGGRPVAELDDLVVRASRLDAIVLECWARGVARDRAGALGRRPGGRGGRRGRAPGVPDRGPRGRGLGAHGAGAARGR